MAKAQPHTTEEHLQNILDFFDIKSADDCPYCIKHLGGWPDDHLPDCIFEKARKWQELVFAIRDHVLKELQEED